MKKINSEIYYKLSYRAYATLQLGNPYLFVDSKEHKSYTYVLIQMYQMGLIGIWE